MLGVQVIVEDLKSHPYCAHGPTILFERKSEQFFACSACRDQKLCSFQLDKKDLPNFKAKKQAFWEKERKKLVQKINHRQLYQTLNEIKAVGKKQRGFCHTCSSFEPTKYWEKHESHDLLKGVGDYQIAHPTEFLAPKSESKREAQYLFANSSVETIINIFKQLKYRKVVSLGTPRIHEYITNNQDTGLNSLLLDFDSRYHHFYGPLEFCWYNACNNHFFLPESKDIFTDFLKTDVDEELVLVFDPPFGGRVELLAETFTQLDQNYKKINKTDISLPIFLIFPYFMESHILNSLPNFEMLDYKIDYDNHPSFKSGPKARKLGSPVRIFTNVSPSRIKLPEDGYKYCKTCKKWVAIENRHCSKCQKCTSKDGSTYVHCDECERCVKPTWQHCDECHRCAIAGHKCGEIEFTNSCFHCKKSGHKKRECPDIEQGVTPKKKKRTK